MILLLKINKVNGSKRSEFRSIKWIINAERIIVKNRWKYR
jgi:hypothetical protein